MIKKTYSFIKNGKTNDVYTLTNKLGAEVDVLTYGARIIRISVPDKNGCFDDVVVGCKTPEDYYGDNPYFGATVGRYANRIGGSRFPLNGEMVTVEANEGKNSLHGGTTAGFDRQIWDAEIVNDALVLTLVSPDGAGGYPGELTVRLEITFSDKNELRLDYKAVSTKDTVLNLTNHTYFNIGKQPTVLEQELFINAKKITPTDEELIPHGEFLDIEGTPYSFLPAKPLGKDMFSDAELIRRCSGFDFNYCIDKVGRGLERCARVYDPETGRTMDTYTTLPGVQLYTACKTGGFVGKKAYVDYCALCLETQYYPNSPNCPSYPSALLKAGETYHEITAYRFSIKR